MDAYLQLLRCARHQLREDVALFQHLLEQSRVEALLRPNLLLASGASRHDAGTLVPMLCLKAG